MAVCMFKFSSFCANVSCISVRGFPKIGTRSSRIVMNRKASFHIRSLQGQTLSPQTRFRSDQMINLLQRNYFHTVSYTKHAFLPEAATKLNYIPGILKKDRQTPMRCTTRSINIMSKLGKRKTCKAVAKRFHRTGKGKLKRWRAGKNHNMLKKRNRTRRQLRKPTYASKSQLKLLNKMLNGW